MPVRASARALPANSRHGGAERGVSAGGSVVNARSGRGSAAVAIFPTRNVNVLRAVRALTCVARLFADLNFIAFQDAAALRAWLAENDGPLRAGAASALNLAVPTGGSLGMDHLLARFCTLAADWPGDCAELEPMLAAEHVGEAQAGELLLAGAPTPKHREEEATVGTSKRWAGC
jgi:hypothetical protein